jgi:pimeloyl-ACP methyl ester carboxylesterase
MNMSDIQLPNIGTVSTAQIDGLKIRYAKGGTADGIPVLLTAPWPESIYSFHRLLPGLGKEHPYIAMDLPGYGHSDSRPDVMSPEAMGNFVIALMKHFELTQAHIVAPDVGTLAFLFAASKRPDLFESLVIGGGAVRVDLAAGQLKAIINSPPGSFANIDGALGVKDYLEAAAQLTPPAIIEDFRAASSGRRLEDASRFVRAYMTDLPKLELLLANIRTPALVMAGRNDPIVPVANGQLLADKLPHNRFVILDAGHRAWEEAATQYANEIRSWLGGGYRTVEQAQ